MHLHHHLKSKIPIHFDLLKPHVHADAPARLRARQHSQKCYYDRNNEWTPAMVVSEFDALRSYLLKMLDGIVCKRNMPNSSFNNETSCSGSELQENGKSITTMIYYDSATNSVCEERKYDLLPALRPSRVIKRPR
ncbi:hypothetical protein PR048_012944 [Dryococelus australis]|uniref:Uncharacterized protein n=1 Tax=Dryococelus australis TaxID=614101 RepID=A0ABQ9HR73_9NEOP|nr:hypothetical protein PR048_012944 [Dryococelus australis]